VIVKIIQLIESPGPLFYVQRRGGIHNKEFKMFKFRTMHLNDSRAQQAYEGDPRIFPAGRWLRRFSLDELPQVLNVIAGKMSIVGPRPHLAEHNLKFAEPDAEYHIRAFVKPGITGLAQVRGLRGRTFLETEIAARLESDLLYLETWSVKLDLSIIVRTVGQVVFPPKKAL
jgi:lipopolysaccharide/colanic/teichoic acid biosynthesis glycosyltransferase